MPARSARSINTVVLKDGKRIGYNTDWSGFARGFQRGLPGARMERVVQLGAGGAGAAVAHAALTMGARALTCSIPTRHARNRSRRAFRIGT